MIRDKMTEPLVARASGTATVNAGDYLPAQSEAVRMISHTKNRQLVSGLAVGVLALLSAGCPLPRPCQTQSDCDDGLFCTGQEVCTRGLCVDGPAPCAEDEACVELGNECRIEPLLDPAGRPLPDGTCTGGVPYEGYCACNDYIDCTEDLGDEAGLNGDGDECGHVPNNDLCDDGIECTDDRCDTDFGGCVHIANDAECDDGIDCTIDTCDTNVGGCVYLLDDSLCDDGSFCNGTESCDPDDGCLEGLPPSCDDGNPCTIDDCDPSNDECRFVAIDCDDDDPCTIDECDVDIGECTSVPIECDDDLYCNGIEVCIDGVCRAGAPPCQNGQECREAEQMCGIVDDCLRTMCDGLEDSAIEMAIDVFAQAKNAGDSRERAFEGAYAECLDATDNRDAGAGCGLCMSAVVSYVWDDLPLSTIDDSVQTMCPSVPTDVLQNNMEFLHDRCISGDSLRDAYLGVGGSCAGQSTRQGAVACGLCVGTFVDRIWEECRGDCG